ncbi:MAG: hypothetical protein ACRCSN_14000 [Dermatophilaceae bacterium]
MTLGPDPALASAALARLQALREVAAVGEDDILSCLVVTGEPVPQRVLDDWVDQVADTLRAIGETVDDLAPVLARHAAGPSATGSVARAAAEHHLDTGSRADR